MQLNRAIKHAKGDYLINLHSGDFFILIPC